MFALIQKSDNAILRVGAEFFELSQEKPFYWVACPENCTTQWTYDGDTFTAPVVPEPAPGEIFARAVESIRAALQGAIDVKARALGFSGGNALMLYAGFTNPFQSLAQTFAAWEASVWYEAELYKAEVIAGTKPMLSPEQAIALMPEYPL